MDAEDGRQSAIGRVVPLRFFARRSSRNDCACPYNPEPAEGYHRAPGAAMRINRSEPLREGPSRGFILSRERKRARTRQAGASPGPSTATIDVARSGSKRFFRSELSPVAERSLPRIAPPRSSVRLRAGLPNPVVAMVSW